MPSSGVSQTVNVGEALRILNSAYAQLKGAEANKAISPYVLDHAIQEQIDSLKAPSSSTGAVSAVDTKYSTSKTKNPRLAKYDRLLNLQKSLQDIVTAVKNAGNDQDKLSKLGLGG